MDQILVRVKYLCSLYQCLHQPCDHDSWEDLATSVWCCLLSPCFCIFMCKSERQTTVPIFRIVPLHLGSRHCIVGSFEWIDHWCMLGTHDGTRSCWKGHYLYSRSSIAMIYSMMISGIQFTWDWEDSGWLMLDAKWCSQGKKVYCLTALWLLQWVYNVDISPGLITKVLSMQQNVIFLSFSCIPWFGMCLFTCP